MALLKTWRDMAYSATANKGDLQRLLGRLFSERKGYLCTAFKEPG